jgi:hypothetical protein
MSGSVKAWGEIPPRYNIGMAPPRFCRIELPFPSLPPQIEIHSAYQTDFLIHISVFHFPSLHLSFIIAAARGGRAMVYDKRKMENGK